LYFHGREHDDVDRCTKGKPHVQPQSMDGAPRAESLGVGKGKKLPFEEEEKEHNI